MAQGVNFIEGGAPMDEFGCDYVCRTVGESITKYNIPDDWCAEFDAYDDIHPIICVQVDQIRKTPAMMDFRIRIVEDEEDEYAGCMVLTDQKTVAFKIDYMGDLVKAMETRICKEHTKDGSMH